MFSKSCFLTQFKLFHHRVQEDADKDQIKKAYRRKSLQWHPDKHPEQDRPAASVEFQKISAAFNKLQDDNSDSDDEDYDSDFDDDIDLFHVFNLFARMSGGHGGGGSGFRGGPGVRSYSSGGGGGFVHPASFFGGGGYGFEGYRPQYKYSSEGYYYKKPEEKKLSEAEKAERKAEQERAARQAKEQRDRWLEKLSALSRLSSTNTSIKLGADNSEGTRSAHLSSHTISEGFYWELQYKAATDTDDYLWLISVKDSRMDVLVTGLQPGTEYLFRARPCVRLSDGGIECGEWGVEYKTSTSGVAVESKKNKNKKKNKEEQARKDGETEKAGDGQAAVSGTVNGGGIGGDSGGGGGTTEEENQQEKKNKKKKGRANDGRGTGSTITTSAATSNHRGGIHASDPEVEYEAALERRRQELENQEQDRVRQEAELIRLAQEASLAECAAAAATAQASLDAAFNNAPAQQQEQKKQRNDRQRTSAKKKKKPFSPSFSSFPAANQPHLVKPIEKPQARSRIPSSVPFTPLQTQANDKPGAVLPATLDEDDEPVLSFFQAYNPNPNPNDDINHHTKSTIYSSLSSGDQSEISKADATSSPDSVYEHSNKAKNKPKSQKKKVPLEDNSKNSNAASVKAEVHPSSSFTPSSLHSLSTATITPTTNPTNSTRGVRGGRGPRGVGRIGRGGGKGRGGGGGGGGDRYESQPEKQCASKLPAAAAAAAAPKQPSDSGVTPAAPAPAPAPQKRVRKYIPITTSRISQPLTTSAPVSQPEPEQKQQKRKKAPKKKNLKQPLQE